MDIISHIFFSLKVRLLLKLQFFFHTCEEARESLLIGPNFVFDQPLTSVDFLVFGSGLTWDFGSVLEAKFFCEGDNIFGHFDLG